MTNPNRLRIALLLNSAEVFNNFVDVETCIRTLIRNGKLHIWSVFAAKGKRAIYIDKIEDVRDLQRILNEFNAIQD